MGHVVFLWGCLFRFALAVVFLEDARGVGVVAFHVAVPFTGASHVFWWEPAVVGKHELELGVDAALEPVAVAGDGPVFE